MSGMLSRLLQQKSGIRTSAELDAFLRGEGGPSSTGISVTPERALTITTVYACIRVLAESVAQLPLIVYKRLPDGGKVRAPEHPLYRILHDSPNEFQTSFEWREMLQGHTCLRGNSYAFINRVRGEVRELLPIHPDRVVVEQSPQWRPIYKVTMDSGEVKPFQQRDILHIKGLSSNGYVGLSPVSLFREALGLALATEKHGGKLFGNGTRLGGILTHPGTLKQETHNRIKKSWEESHAGLENAFKTALLEEGMDWKSVGMTSEDAQFLETRKFQRGEIASIYRVPPHMIGDLERSTNNNIEQQSLEFVIYSLTPWLKRWESRLSKDLLSPQDQEIYVIEFLEDGLLRGDFKTRVFGYQSALNNGWMSPNEVREKENLNPVPGGDQFMRPLNMTPLVGNPSTESPQTPVEGG